MTLENPRIARLTEIVTLLQSKKILNAREIATKFKVSIRTVYRDIKTLEDSGIPITTLEGKGYSLIEGYKLPPIMFSEEEALALIMAEKIISRNKDVSLIEKYQSAIVKIKAVLSTKQKNKNEFIANRIQIRNNADNTKTSNYLIQLQTYISNFRTIEITYHSLENNYTQRKIEPFALYTTNNNWILIAFCKTRKDFRAFRLDRILKIVETSIFFEPHTLTLEQYIEDRKNK